MVDRAVGRGRKQVIFQLPIDSSELSFGKRLLDLALEFDPLIGFWVLGICERTQHTMNVGPSTK